MHSKIIVVMITFLMFTNHFSQSKNADNMIFVQGRTFIMGGERNYEQGPKHKVTLKSFYIDKFETTIKEYIEFCKATGYKTPEEPLSGWIDNYPIVGVTWNDAVAYAKWRGKRLPTDAEWEFAARGGIKSKNFEYSGSDNVLEVAWTYENSYFLIQPTGTKAPNELGIFDMSGNVWEWCSDWYDSTYYKHSPVDNPQGAKSGEAKIRRGGAYRGDPECCRVTGTGWFSPNETDGDIGFRCVKEIETK